MTALCHVRAVAQRFLRSFLSWGPSSAPIHTQSPPPPRYRRGNSPTEPAKRSLPADRPSPTTPQAADPRRKIPAAPSARPAESSHHEQDSHSTRSQPIIRSHPLTFCVSCMLSGGDVIPPLPNSTPKPFPRDSGQNSRAEGVRPLRRDRITCGGCRRSHAL